MRPEDSREINLLHNLLAIVALKRAVHGCLFSAKVGFGLSMFLGRLSWCVLIIFPLRPVYRSLARMNPSQEVVASNRPHSRPLVRGCTRPRGRRSGRKRNVVALVGPKSIQLLSVLRSSENLALLVGSLPRWADRCRGS